VAKNRTGARGSAEIGRLRDDDARSDELNREIGRDIVLYE
jgi:hypothetical protein